MLLGSGNLLDKLPLTQTGGVINNTNWMNPSIAMVGVDSFDKKSSLPNGYSGRAFYLPMKAGGLSGFSFSEIVASANGNNGTSGTVSTAEASLSGTVGLVGSSNSLCTLDGAIMALAIASGAITILCSVSANVSAALNGSGNSLSLCTANGAVIGAVSGYGSSTAVLTINADMVGIFEGYGSSNSTLSLGLATLNGKANAIVSIVSSSTTTATTRADGFMSGSNASANTALTAKDVWEYYQRTLTTGGSDSFTLDEIASAVRTKIVGDIYAAPLIG